MKMRNKVFICVKEKHMEYLFLALHPQPPFSVLNLDPRCK